MTKKKFITFLIKKLEFLAQKFRNNFYVLMNFKVIINLIKIKCFVGFIAFYEFLVSVSNVRLSILFQGHIKFRIQNDNS